MAHRFMKNHILRRCEIENLLFPNIFIDLELHHLIKQFINFNEFTEIVCNVETERNSNEFILAKLINTDRIWRRSKIATIYCHDVKTCLRFLIPCEDKLIVFICEEDFARFEEIFKRKFSEDFWNKNIESINDHKLLFNPNRSVKLISFTSLLRPYYYDKGSVVKGIVKIFRRNKFNSDFFIEYAQSWHQPYSLRHTAISIVPQANTIVSLVLDHIRTVNLNDFDIFDVISVQFAFPEFSELDRIKRDIDLIIKQKIQEHTNYQLIFDEFDLNLYIKQIDKNVVEFEQFLYFLWKYGSEIKSFNYDILKFENVDYMYVKGCIQLLCPNVSHGNKTEKIDLRYSKYDSKDVLERLLKFQENSNWASSINPEIWHLNTLPETSYEIDMRNFGIPSIEWFLKVISLDCVKSIKIDLNIHWVEEYIFDEEVNQISVGIEHLVSRPSPNSIEIYNCKCSITTGLSKKKFAKVIEFLELIMHNQIFPENSDSRIEVDFVEGNVFFLNIHFNSKDLVRIKELDLDFRKMSFSKCANLIDEMLVNILQTQNNLEDIYIGDCPISEAFFLLYAEKEMFKKSVHSFSFNKSRPKIHIKQNNMDLYGKFLHDYTYMLTEDKSKIIVNENNIEVLDLCGQSEYQGTSREDFDFYS